jgi:hypothetical protein
MVGMLQVGSENCGSFGRGDGIGREGRIGRDTNESGLRKGACSPALMGIVGEPFLRFIMVFMGRSHERNKQVNVEEKCGHF